MCSTQARMKSAQSKPSHNHTTHNQHTQTQGQEKRRTRALCKAKKSHRVQPCSTPNLNWVTFAITCLYSRNSMAIFGNLESAAALSSKRLESCLRHCHLFKTTSCNRTKASNPPISCFWSGALGPCKQARNQNHLSTPHTHTHARAG